MRINLGLEREGLEYVRDKANAVCLSRHVLLRLSPHSRGDLEGSDMGTSIVPCRP